MGQQDINAEYERIFGVVKYPTLFNTDDVEYNELRETITTAPRIVISSKNLPFENIYDFSVEQDFENFLDCPDQETYCFNIYNVVIGIHNHATKILTGILSVLVGDKQLNDIFLPKNLFGNHNHVFWITKTGRCKVYGYFDKETKNFYIGTGSLISVVDDADYIDSSSYRKRHKLINKYGINNGRYIKIYKDVKCRSAVAAARYALGAMVNLDLWKDSQGRTLYDVYPDFFFH